MAGPYELQSPKDIAMEYGGNKQKIAQATQMGLIDPTAAVLAGMFIDRMRSAQQEEMAPQQTVAQQVMAPPQMAAGLGATPQAAMAPQMPQQMPTEAGVAALPVPDEMVPSEYAGGGIIAFANGGMPINYEDELFKSGLGEKFKQREMLREKVLGKDQSVADLMGYVQGLEDKAGERADRLFNLRLAQAGLGIAAGQSPYALQNIATGAAPALQGYGEDIARQEEATLGRKKVLAELGGKERAERAKSFEGLLDEQAKISAANIAAGKQTDMKYYADQRLKASRGDPEAKIIVEAIETYLPLVGTSGVRAEAAIAQAQTAESKAEATARDRAIDAVEKSVSPGGANNTRFRQLEKIDRDANKGLKPGDPGYSNEAEKFKQRLIDDRLRMGEPKPTAAKPTAASGNKPPPPSAAITQLKADPSDLAKKQFDEVFGKGAANRVLTNK